MVDELPAPLGAGVYNVYPARRRAAWCHRRAARAGTAPVLRRMWTPDDRAGAPGRLVGAVLEAWTGGLHGPGGAAMSLSGEEQRAP